MSIGIKAVHQKDVCVDARQGPQGAALSHWLFPFGPLEQGAIHLGPSGHVQVVSAPQMSYSGREGFLMPAGPLGCS